MSVKYFNKEKNQWVIFPGTMGAPGKDAYLIAQENGYTGTKEEYNKVLVEIPKIIESIENTVTEGSKNLITSGGVWTAIDELNKSVETDLTKLEEKVNINTSDIANNKDVITTLNRTVTEISATVTRIINTEISDQIKASIIDDLESTDPNKVLSAKQGNVLKTMIGNLANLQISVVNTLPLTGETNIIYLVKKEGTTPDIHDEYVYVEDTWEKIGNTDVDLSNYYTKDQVYTKDEVYTKNEVYTKAEVEDKLSDSGLGDVIAATPFTTADRVITSNGAGKIVKDSGVLIENLALKSYVDDKEIAWDKVTGKPETYVPAAHTHPLAQITDAGALAYKDKVDESDLNFDIPDGTVVDSSLSTSSVNPVQNKVVTEALNNRYTKSETYSQSEIDEKIGSAGAGDVMASGNLAANYIIIGAGTKSIKNSGQLLSNLALKSDIPSLNGYATQEWVNNQGYSTENTWRPVKVGSTTLNDDSTTLTIASGTGIGLTFSNGTLTITNSAPGSSYVLPVANVEILGGIKTGFNETQTNIPVHVDNKQCAYVSVSKSSIVAALQYTPADITDIPEIPIALPNPYSLSIIAGDSTKTYTGSSAVSINLNNFFSKKLDIATNPGNPGIYFTSSTAQVTIIPNVTEDKPDAIVIVPVEALVTIDEHITYNSLNADNLFNAGTTGTYKCFCISWVASAERAGLKEDLVLVNGAIYG